MYKNIKARGKKIRLARVGKKNHNKKAPRRRIGNNTNTLDNREWLSEAIREWPSETKGKRAEERNF